MQLLKQKTIRWISLLCIVALSAAQMFRETPDAQGAVPDGSEGFGTGGPPVLCRVME